MSPERARGEPSTLASDLWSLGATLYAALDCRSPFERSGSLPTLNAVLHDPASRLVPGTELGDLISALLAKEPARRPSPLDVHAALLGILARPNEVPSTAGSVESAAGCDGTGQGAIDLAEVTRRPPVDDGPFPRPARASWSADRCHLVRGGTRRPRCLSRRMAYAGIDLAPGRIRTRRIRGTRCSRVSAANSGCGSQSTTGWRTPNRGSAEPDKSAIRTRRHLRATSKGQRPPRYPMAFSCIPIRPASRLRCRPARSWSVGSSNGGVTSVVIRTSSNGKGRPSYS